MIIIAFPYSIHRLCASIGAEHAWLCVCIDCLCHDDMCFMRHVCLCVCMCAFCVCTYAHSSRGTVTAACVTGSSASVDAEAAPVITVALAVECASGSGDTERRSCVYVYDAEAPKLSISVPTKAEWNLQGKFPVYNPLSARGEGVLSMCWIESEDVMSSGASLTRRTPALLIGTASRCRAYVNHRQFNRWDAAPELVDIEIDPASGGCSCVAWAPGDMEREVTPDSAAAAMALACGSDVLLVNVGRYVGSSGTNENSGGRIVAKLEHGAKVERIAWNFIGTELATADATGTKRLWAPNLLSEWIEQQTL